MDPSTVVCGNKRKTKQKEEEGFDANSIICQLLLSILPSCLRVLSVSLANPYLFLN